MRQILVLRKMTTNMMRRVRAPGKTLQIHSSSKARSRLGHTYTSVMPSQAAAEKNEDSELACLALSAVSHVQACGLVSRQKRSFERF